MGLRELITRHQELIDIKFTAGLSAAQEEELSNIEEQLDNIDAKFYEPIIYQVEELIKSYGFPKD